MTIRTDRDRPGFVRLLREAGLLLLVSLLLAGVSWLVRTPRLPLRADESDYAIRVDFPVVPAADALGFYDANSHIFIDARPGADDHDAIPGSMAVRQDSFDDDLLEIHDFLMPEDPLLLYGDGNLLALAAVAARLQERGYSDLTLMEGGLVAWRKAGGPVNGTESSGENAHE